MESLLTIDELSTYLKVPKKTIYDMVYTKRIPYSKIGRLLRFDKQLIDTWISRNTKIPFDMNFCYNKFKVKGEENNL